MGMAVMMMAVAAVLVMHMIVMRVAVVMAVMRVLVPAMIVMIIVAMMVIMFIMALRMAGLGIGAAFRIERRLDLDDARAETLDHRLDHVVTADAQALGHDLGRQMPVPEMPGEPHQMVWIAGADLQQRLRRGNDLDQPAVLQHQGIAAAKRGGVREVEHECEPARAGHRQPSPMPIVEIEQDGIGGRLCPTMLPQHTRGADHADILIS